MSNTDPRPVTDSMLCFGLYSAARATTRAYRAFLEPWQLTYPQYLVMLLLWTGEEQTVSSLGRAMQLDSGTLSPLLRRLEQSGYVSRTRDDSDERVMHVRATAAGTALRQELAHIPGAFQQLTSGCDDTDLATLIGTLKTLTSSLEHATAAKKATAHPATPTA